MNEYILISSKRKQNENFYDSWVNQYLIQKNYLRSYDDYFFQHWCNSLDDIDSYLFEEYKNRYDYKCDENLHMLYNELTKEIIIIITNRYQILIKCDKIPIGVIETVRNYYPNIRLFCRNKEIKEVET